MATTLAALHAKGGRRASTVRPMVLAVLHPKGGVGRSTTVWQLGAELALRGKRVRIEDLDQGRHLSRVFERHPLGLEGLQLGSSPIGKTDADVVLLDTAPEAQRERALEILRRADWLLVPVKGPEEGSVQALPALLKWLQEADGARLLGFLPTMSKPRRIEVRYWLSELQRLAERNHTRVFEPIGDLASVAAWRLDGHPYARVAEEILHATNSA
ncbi:MAG: ParA family protein [Candidatus Dormibacteraeota bacterium]|nr:ParA family protein [Candidatus Dormibacteraeota bacterium]